MNNLFITDRKWIAEKLSEQVSKEDILVIGADYELMTDKTGHPLFTISINESKQIQIRYIYKNIELLKKIKLSIESSTEIINVCSCNEEGQLNFNMLTIALGLKKDQARRIWFQEKEEIKIGETEPNYKYDSLAAALLCEKVIDLYWAKNSFRLFDASSSISYKELYILLNLYQREQRIETQENSTGYRIQLNASKNLFKWYRKSRAEGTVEKLNTIEDAIQIKERLKDSKLLITSNKRKIVEKEHPFLMNNTDIYRFAKKNDLGTVEEIKKALDYLHRNGYISNPDTQNRYLPIKIKNDILTIIKAIKFIPEIRPYIDYLKEKYEHINFRNCALFNDRLSEKNHAIIPTGKPIYESGISGIESVLYIEISRRFISILFPLQKKETFCITGMVDASNFARLDLENIIEYGWSIIDYAPENLTEISENTNKSGEEATRFTPGTIVNIDEIIIAPSIPRTIKRYTLSQLLNIVEFSGRTTIRGQMKKALATEDSIGVKTDKSYILSGMMNKNLIREHEKFVILTEKSLQMLNSLPTSLHKQRVLQEMNRKLKQVREGKVNYKDAITSHLKVLERCISESYQVRHMVKTNYTDIINMKCPFCGSLLEEKMKYIACKNCSLAIRKIIYGYTLTVDDMKQLLLNGETKTITGFTTKDKSNVSGILCLHKRFRNVTVRL